MKSLLSVLSVAVTIGSYGQTSSVNPKIKPESSQNYLQKIIHLSPNVFQYDLLKSKASGNTQVGFNTEEIKKAFPELVVRKTKMVSAGKNSFRIVQYETIDSIKMIPYMLKAIQELQQEIDELKSKPAAPGVIPPLDSIEENYREWGTSDRIFFCR